MENFSNKNIGGCWAVALLAECLPGVHESPTLHKPGVVAHTCNSKTQEDQEFRVI